ncbi:hypothetical protein SAMN04487911_107117 [Arenibacter nanhaiticus]|uniref:Uncharacterized protein n=1 Tax=Arenibacter nanhaiticus TaxID=558155 RepID=A0A1M6EZU1_9FLAO|nr:hypothetical protein [Arenibacter nanhaiticus]SHI90925.1 hypothetical protein SAMN04487911_107117 [Arenibacter nanhaiticus]
MTKIITFSLVLASLLFIQCTSDKDKFLIAKDHVGRLNKFSIVDEFDNIYASDSIVKDTIFTNIGVRTQKIQVYEKGGKHLLSITPTTDSIQKVDIVRIFDPRFKTEQGVGLNSTFKDIRDKHEIKKIVTSMNNIVVFLKDSDAYFTIEKKELPANLQYSNTSIEAVQIPDNAKIKYIMVGWE